MLDGFRAHDFIFEMSESFSSNFPVLTFGVISVSGEYFSLRDPPLYMNKIETVLGLQTYRHLRCYSHLPYKSIFL